VKLERFLEFDGILLAAEASFIHEALDDETCVPAYTTPKPGRNAGRLGRTYSIEKCWELRSGRLRSP